ncbi:MAG: acyl-CoA dehydrogenase [Fulvimarina manganoxydans]|uniref:acyl-CoA dehydrogenase family protein n=1 Tax=Fulvimarina manganoxydans TaxID=937218 RepID=UPI0023546F1F|nr:acyl-CoA dehydrogenase family protein [Fulvimarina manganoxydans]MCK5930941.1 acyl-CoA dehydrogenase [Fulvimarina manganoxydans]
MSADILEQPKIRYRTFEAAFGSARESGLFRAVGRLYSNEGTLGPDWVHLMDRLRDAGATNLNLGRLLEGHANAVQLVRLYGDAGQHAWLEKALEADTILGVWGADDVFPARVETVAGGKMLKGGKRYASGLGMVAHAVVPIAGDDGQLQLYLLPVGDPARQDLSAWKVGGMQASASGRYSFEGVSVEPGMMLGGVGVYKREPFFEGGIWRCAAVHLGGLEAILAMTVAHLEASGRFDHPLQTERLGHAILHARTARLWVEDAGRRIEDPLEAETIPFAVAAASYTRLQVEASALAVMEIARRSVGLASFERDHPLESAIADLSVYLRQANPDALLLHKCRTMLTGLGQ